MKQIVSSYSYSPTTNVVTLSGVNIEQDQLLLVVAPQVGRTMYNFASGVTGSVVTGTDTRVTLNASTVGLTTTSPLVIFYDDQALATSVTGTVTANVGQDYGALVISESVGNQDNGTLLDISQYPSGTLLQVELTASAGSAVRKFEYRDSANQYPDGDIVLTKAYDNSSTLTNFGGASGGTGVWVFRKSKNYFRASYESAGQGNNTIAYKILAFSDPNRGFNQTISGTVTVGNSVTIGSLPAISGTVTASLAPQAKGPTSEIDSAVPSDPKYMINVGGIYPELSEYRSLRLGSSGEVVVSSVTIGSLPTLTPQLPRVTFIDGSGTVVTANSAVTLFASSTTRSYLLVQVTTGSAFVNVGATATTVNGINLTAGQGYAWETTIPQGLVSLISTSTSSRWVAKEA
jgi:hypothetical protein